MKPQAWIPIKMGKMWAVANRDRIICDNIADEKTAAFIASISDFVIATMALENLADHLENSMFKTLKDEPNYFPIMNRIRKLRDEARKQLKVAEDYYGKG